MGSYHRLFALLAVTLMLGLAACGGAPTATGQLATTAPTGHCPASAGLPSNTSDHGTVAAPDSQLAIEANDFFFSPTCVTGVSGGAISLTVHNVGQALHNISIPSLGIDMDLAPGQTIIVPVRTRSAPLVFFCKYHKSVGMFGALLPSGTAHGCCCCGGSASGYAAVPAA
jgi:hypothetical protein